jgi:hypothetical protein
MKFMDLDHAICRETLIRSLIDNKKCHLQRAYMSDGQGKQLCATVTITVRVEEPAEGVAKAH